MLLWLQFITKYCYRLQEEFGNAASPSSLSDLFKHCHKRHWIQCGEGGQLLPSCTNCTGRARCFHMGICARLTLPCSDICTTPGQQPATSAQAENRLSYGCYVIAWARAGPLTSTDWAGLMVTDVHLPWLGQAVGDSWYCGKSARSPISTGRQIRAF